jgi:hypothetical protein
MSRVAWESPALASFYWGGESVDDALDRLERERGDGGDLAAMAPSVAGDGPHTRRPRSRSARGARRGRPCDVYAEAGSSSFLLNLAETYAPLVASNGLLSAADVDAWLADQRRSAQDGTFFVACNYYACIAKAGE